MADTPRHMLHYPHPTDPFNPGSDMAWLATSADISFPRVVVTDGSPPGPSGPFVGPAPQEGDLWLQYVQDVPTGPTGP